MKTLFISSLILLMTSCVTSFASDNSSTICNDDEYSAGQPNLHNAAREGNLEVLEECIKTANNLNLQDENGNTPLHLSLTSVNLKFTEEILPRLIKDKKDINLQNKKGETPLHFALYNKDNAHNAQIILDHLITTKQDINLQDYLGDTPLHLALSYKYHICTEKILDYLIENKKDINIPD